MAVVVEAFRVAGSVEKRQERLKVRLHSFIHSFNKRSLCDSEGPEAMDTSPLCRHSLQAGRQTGTDHSSRARGEGR